jgi:hypothetical protein
MEKDLFETGFEKALNIISKCATPYGFVASTTDQANYKRIWARDGVIISLTALLTEDKDLHKTVLSTLRTLSRHLGPHGEVPSNVDPEKGRISYGGTAGRVDAGLWFLIGCYAYWKKTGDARALEEFLPIMKTVQFLLGAWEFNDKGLIYVPETGDWSDEYIQHGYVLYDQILYWKALSGLSEIYKKVEGKRDHVLETKVGLLLDLIKHNYWFYKTELDETKAYHPSMYRNGFRTGRDKNPYWLSYFSPVGYGRRFDSMANVLVSLFGIADEDQAEKTDGYIEDKVINKELKVLPAFYPVIEEVDEDWKKLQATFSFTFRNNPYEYHNGGLWPLINGFYVADLARRGKKAEAKMYLKAIHLANKMDAEGGEWGFYEFIHGRKLIPGGTRNQGWSASAAVLGHYALQGKEYF